MRLLLHATLAFLLAPVAAAPAWASGPVPATITGCVLQGALIGGRQPGARYVIRPMRAGQPLDLSRYEGQRLRFTGQLLPGDRYIVETGPEVLGPCP